MGTRKSLNELIILLYSLSDSYESLSVGVFKNGFVGLWDLIEITLHSSYICHRINLVVKEGSANGLKVHLLLFRQRYLHFTNFQDV